MTFPGVEIAAPPDSETALLIVVFTSTTVGVTDTGSVPVSLIVSFTWIVTPGFANSCVWPANPKPCEFSVFVRAWMFTFSILTSVVA